MPFSTSETEIRDCSEELVPAAMEHVHLPCQPKIG